MQLNSAALLVLLLECSIFAAAQVSTFETCFTSHGTKSVRPVPTTTHTVTSHVTASATTTVRPTKTVTPAAATTTTTIYSTSITTKTLAQKTDTFSTTTTRFYTTTFVALKTTLTTSTVTTYFTTTPTYTQPASAGFTPLASVLVASGFTANEDNSAPSPAPHRRRGLRDAEYSLEQRAGKPHVVDSFRIEAPAATTRFPTRVVCSETIESTTTTTVTRTGTRTATITAPQQTTTRSTTSNIVVTSTKTPADASTTLSFSTLKTISTTTTTTATTTYYSSVNGGTVAAPTATVYAACFDNNLINGVDGHGINANGAYYGYTTTSAINSGYDCCVSCLLAGTSCGASGVNPGYYCYNFGSSGTCSGSTPTGEFFGTSQFGAGGGYIMSNSNCGQLQYMGLDA